MYSNYERAIENKKNVPKLLAGNRELTKSCTEIWTGTRELTKPYTQIMDLRGLYYKWLEHC